jgi:hypothetical protein
LPAWEFKESVQGLLLSKVLYDRTWSIAGTHFDEMLATKLPANL